MSSTEHKADESSDDSDREPENIEEARQIIDKIRSATGDLNDEDETELQKTSKVWRRKQYNKAKKLRRALASQAKT